MTKAYRVVQDQARNYSYDATKNAEEAAYLESVLELTKPKETYSQWHRLIAAPFRYSLPVQPAYQARFTPPYFDRNALYCSEKTETALHEHAYHFLKQRVHLKGAVVETGMRTIFSLSVDEASVTDISNRPDIARITDRRDYSASHAYIQGNPKIEAIKYPSCRDPKRQPNFAILDINLLGKKIGNERTMSIYFDPAQQLIRWFEDGHNLDIGWKTVA